MAQAEEQRREQGSQEPGAPERAGTGEAQAAAEAPTAEAEAAPPAGASEPAGEQQAAVEQLQAELAAAREEAQRNREGWARAQAELENYRRRAQKEKEESIQYEVRRLALNFLPVLDNLERALAVPEGGDASGLVAGVELTVRQFRDALARAGIEAISVNAGDPFDPNLHEAVLQVEGESEEPVVAEVLQNGYRMGERLVRPAMVKVARKGV